MGKDMDIGILALHRQASFEIATIASVVTVSPYNLPTGQLNTTGVYVVRPSTVQQFYTK